MLLIFFILAIVAFSVFVFIDVGSVLAVDFKLMSYRADFQFSQLGFLLFTFIQALSLPKEMVRTLQVNRQLRSNLQTEVELLT